MRRRDGEKRILWLVLILFLTLNLAYGCNSQDSSKESPAPRNTPTATAEKNTTPSPKPTPTQQECSSKCAPMPSVKIIVDNSRSSYDNIDRKRLIEQICTDLVDMFEEARKESRGTWEYELYRFAGKKNDKLKLEPYTSDSRTCKGIVDGKDLDAVEQFRYVLQEAKKAASEAKQDTSMNKEVVLYITDGIAGDPGREKEKNDFTTERCPECQDFDRIQEWPIFVIALQEDGPSNKDYWTLFEDRNQGFLLFDHELSSQPFEDYQKKRQDLFNTLYEFWKDYASSPLPCWTLDPSQKVYITFEPRLCPNWGMLNKCTPEKPLCMYIYRRLTTSLKITIKGYWYDLLPQNPDIKGDIFFQIENNLIYLNRLPEEIVQEVEQQGLQVKPEMLYEGWFIEIQNQRYLLHFSKKDTMSLDEILGRAIIRALHNQRQLCSYFRLIWQPRNNIEFQSNSVQIGRRVTVLQDQHKCYGLEITKARITVKFDSSSNKLSFTVQIQEFDKPLPSLFPNLFEANLFEEGKAEILVWGDYTVTYDYAKGPLEPSVGSVPDLTQLLHNPAEISLKAQSSRVSSFTKIDKVQITIIEQVSEDRGEGLWIGSGPLKCQELEETQHQNGDREWVFECSRR